METMSKDEIFNRFKAVENDNKKLYALCAEIAEKIRMLSKAQTAYFQNDLNEMDDIEFKQALSVLDEPERARAWLLLQLKKGMENAPNAQIAKELRDLLGIVSNENEMIVQTINYKNAELNCPKCGYELAKQHNSFTGQQKISDETGPDSPK